MKINVLASIQSPDYYEIIGEVVKAFFKNHEEIYDLSEFPEGGLFTGTSLSKEFQDIRNVERVNGELKVTLCQQVGPGHWMESGWFDAVDYDPDKIHTRISDNKNYVGLPWAKTRNGKEYI